ncbi:MAG: uroporphyrinogen-III synthase [Hyphomicrobium sp.]|jgi:uroporphyrinogen-III synthase
MHLLVTRPEGDGASLIASLEAVGHRVSSAPLLSIEPVEPALDLLDTQALIATSRNALKALAANPALAAAMALPLFAVGPATASLARSIGFSTVLEGPAGASELVRVIEAHATRNGGALLHLAGDRLAFDLRGALEAKGFRVRQEVMYRTHAAQALNPEVVDAIRAGKIDGVILMSSRAATIFSDLAAKAGIRDQATGLCYICLSEAVAGGLAPLSPGRVYVARTPNLQETLALIARVAADFDNNSFDKNNFD